MVILDSGDHLSWGDNWLFFSSVPTSALGMRPAMPTPLMQTQMLLCWEFMMEGVSNFLAGVSLFLISILYGNEDNPGLLEQLSQRIGILKKLRKVIPDKRFKQIVAGIFQSKMI